MLVSMHSKPIQECDVNALFGGASKLLRRIYPSPLPAEWWVSTCARFDATSAWLANAFQLFNVATLLDPSALESVTWLSPVVSTSVQIIKVNEEARLSSRPTMSFQAVAYPLRLVEMAARVESHIASLLASGVVEALDYACLNDFCLLDSSICSYAAGAVVALVVERVPDFHC